MKTVGTSGPNVVDRPVEDAGDATKGDEKRREVSASLSPAEDAVEAALAEALRGATAAGRWDVVAQLARELEARRLERAGNVVAISPRRGRKA